MAIRKINQKKLKEVANNSALNLPSRDRIYNVLSGTKFDSLEDAIAADLVSAVPIVGAVSDFLRVLDSDTRPQKALQIADFITEPIPILNAVTPTNTLLYLDSMGLLPFKFNEADQFFTKLNPIKNFKKK